MPLNSFKCCFMLRNAFLLSFSNCSPFFLLLLTPTFAMFVNIYAASFFKCFLKLNAYFEIKAVSLTENQSSNQTFSSAELILKTLFNVTTINETTNTPQIQQRKEIILPKCVLA